MRRSLVSVEKARMNLLRHKKRRKRKLWYSKWRKRQHRAETQGRFKHRRRKTTKVSDEIDGKILKSLEKIEPDEDEAFCISVLPSVRQFSADDKLDFRMTVLKAIKDIKTCSGYVSSTFSTQTPSPSNSHGTGRLSHSPCSWLQTPETFDFTPDNRHSQSNANIP